MEEYEIVPWTSDNNEFWVREKDGWSFSKCLFRGSILECEAWVRVHSTKQLT